MSINKCGRSKAWYSGFICRETSMALRHGLHSLPANYTMPAFTSLAFTRWRYHWQLTTRLLAPKFCSSNATPCKFPPWATTLSPRLPPATATSRQASHRTSEIVRRLALFFKCPVTLLRRSDPLFCCYTQYYVVEQAAETQRFRFYQAKVLMIWNRYSSKLRR